MRALSALTVLVFVLSACSSEPSPTPSGSAGASASASAEATPDSPYADAWVDATADTIGETAEYTNRVELADINADGTVDLLFANGAGYESPGELVASWAFANNGDGTFTDVSADVFGDLRDLVRVIKVRDLNADGYVDIAVGTVFERQTRLLMGAADGSFTDVTATNLPQAATNIGDLEIGDVDADGDLDVVMADRGDGNPLETQGPVLLWLNDGAATFTDAGAAQMPDTTVGYSWELELIDVDNDWDLDVATSCKVCVGGLLYENDGEGTFTDVTEGRMPAFGNNYEYEPIDLDGDGYLDLVTINDGVETSTGLAEHVFRNEAGTFVDATDTWWPPAANVGYDDAVATAIDIESDGDADFLVASLDGPDRLLLNDGSGGLTLVSNIIDASPSRGTLGWGITDLNGDGRPDMVESQGEVSGHYDERVYFATEAVPPDTAPPIIATSLGDDPAGDVVIHARVHDNRSPNMPHDWQTVEVRWEGADPVLMTWYGENLFRANVTLPAGASGVQVCAVDRAGNEACSE